MKRFVSSMLLVAAMALLAPATASAHEYDRGDSDHPLRYVGYALHPVGMAFEYALLRPVHWLVSQPTAAEVMGHEPRPGDLDHNFELQ